MEAAIDQVTIVNPAEATATVRRILGPVPRCARFRRIREITEDSVCRLRRQLVIDRLVTVGEK
ncbi:hypothetical protein OG379_02205 [Streptomyces sp. NBC_01166]|uniref:hypothetical protein n=1 Tax=Streptomyces sp. NBC_01166 TaxID=2903755 RepID=UPI00386D42B9|nr:hypothetical protein OG379_02205 [Streptomyces sp. NBC_01166]